MPDDINKKPKLIETIDLKKETLSTPEKDPFSGNAPEKDPRFEQNREKSINIDKKLPELMAEKEGGNGQEQKAFTPADHRSVVRQKQIESVLAEGLDSYYLDMPPAKQTEFRQAGENTAREINGLIEKGKITLKNIVDLIRGWLMLIPGVNRFFLEQEAKIKADEILKIINNKE